MRPRPFAAIFAALLTVAAQGQFPVRTEPVRSAPRRAAGSLYDVVARMAWDPATSGPLVAVTPWISQEGADLAAFGRHTVPVGGLTAVVPLRMVTVDSKFTQAPNLYEGLPQRSKVLYLLRSLDGNQWAKATGEGLSLGDLRGEQTAVFRSILPDPLRYSFGTVQDGLSVAYANDRPKVTLAGPDRERVRLRVTRELDFTLPLKNEDGFTGGGLPMGKKGDQVVMIEDEKRSEYGHTVLVEGPNVARPSALNLRDARLGTTIPLKTGESVAELLARITSATGVHVVAASPYLHLQMFEAGKSAVARDLLGALSLGVAGTYRKVADGYVLTNDAEGMAAHQARIAAWEAAIKEEVDEREKTWRGEIAAVGALPRIPFHGAAYEGLTDAERANMGANDRPGIGENVYMPVSGASRAVREVAERGAHGLQTDPERIGIHSTIGYALVMPDGSTGPRSEWLGPADWFGEGHAAAPRARPPVALPLLPTERLQGLILHADTAAEGADRVARAARLGIEALWLETASPDALAAAVAAGKAKRVKVSLCVRPWTLGPNDAPRDPDRTVTGAHGRTLAAQEAGYGPWTSYWDESTAFLPHVPERLAPIDPEIHARSAAIARLAATKGLASVVLRDLYGIGYAKEESFSYGSYHYTPGVEALLGYGYSDGARAAFFRKEGFDPLDVENPGVRTEIDLRAAWGDAWSSADDAKKWQTARGEWARYAAVGLARQVAGLAEIPVLLSPQAPGAHMPPVLLARYVMAWRPEEDAPVAPNAFDASEIEAASAYKILELRDENDAAFRARLASVLSRTFAAKGTPVVLDLSAVPNVRLEAVLNRWLKPR